MQEKSAALRFDVRFGRGPRAFCQGLLDAPSQAQNLAGMEAEPAMIEDQFGSCQEAMMAQEETGKLS